jgi:hypothetical protein
MLHHTSALQLQKILEKYLPSTVDMRKMFSVALPLSDLNSIAFYLYCIAFLLLPFFVGA